MGLNDLEQRLLALKQRMESGLVERARALRELAERLDSGDATARKAIKTESHKLRGVAGTYGHQDLTNRAAELEQRASLSPPAVVGRMARDLADLVEQASAKSAPAAQNVNAAPAAANVQATTIKRSSERPSSRSSKRPSKRPSKPASDKAAQPKVAKTKLRVLAMDDDPLTLRLLSLTLKNVGGFDATIVESATVALELLAREKFDIVVSDAMMPEMNGRELCLRARELGITAPVVILSAASPEELGWSHTLPGATAWLRKPFKPSELVQDLERIARQHAATSEPR